MKARSILAATALAAALVPLAVPAAQAQHTGQQVCRSGASSSNNDGGVRLYLAGYARHPDIYLNLSRGECYRIPNDDIADAMDVQLRGSGSARWRFTNPSPDGPWHSFTGNRKPQPVGDAYAKNIIEVDR